MKKKGPRRATSEGGDVKVNPKTNADRLNAVKQGEIAGDWVPERWATRLVQEGGGHVLVDERDLGRALVTSETLAAVLDQLVFLQVDAGCHHHARLDCFT